MDSEVRVDLSHSNDGLLCRYDLKLRDLPNSQQQAISERASSRVVLIRKLLPNMAEWTKEGISNQPQQWRRGGASPQCELKSRQRSFCYQPSGSSKVQRSLQYRDEKTSRSTDQPINRTCGMLLKWWRRYFDIFRFQMDSNAHHERRTTVDEKRGSRPCFEKKNGSTHNTHTTSSPSSCWWCCIIIFISYFVGTPWSTFCSSRELSSEDLIKNGLYDIATIVA